MRTVGVRLTADVSAYMSNIHRAGAAAKDFAGQLDKAGRAGRLDAVADQAGLAGLALGGVAGAAIKLSMDFEKAMSAVSAGTNASAGDLEKLREAALAAGKDTQYSATGAAKAITELGKAGVATTDILSGGLKGALALAAAGQMDVSEAAETAASALTQFRLKGSDVPHVADLLAAAAGKAQGSVHDMGYALKAVGLVASQMGLSIEDTTGALASFASAGLIGSDAGTSFKSMIQSLQNPTKESKELMKQLGIQVYDSSGNFVGLTDLAEQLKTKMGGLTQATRDQAMAQLFGSDGIRAAAILYREGATGIQGWIDKVNDAGYASETAAKLTDNLAGDIERLKGSLETMAIESGGGANSGLRVLVKSVEALVDEFGQLPSAVGGTVTVLAGAAGAALVLSAGWVKMRRSTADMLAELRQVGPNGERAASGLQAAGKWAGRAAAAFAAYEVASAAVSATQDKLNPQIEALAKGLEGYATSGDLAGESSRLLGDHMEKLEGKFKFLADDGNKAAAVRNLQGALEGLIPGLDGTDESLARTRERVASLDAAMAQLVQGGKATEAKAAFDRLAKSLATGDVSMEEFRKQFPAYAAALEVAGKETGATTAKTDELSKALGTGAGEQREYENAADAAAGAARGERNALTALSDTLRAQTDPVFGLLDAQDRLAAAQKKAADATRDHGRRSVEAKTATRELAIAALDLQGRAGELARGFNGKLSPALHDAMKAAGLTDKQISNLAGQFKEAKKRGDAYAKKYEARVDLKNYEPTVARLDRLAAYQQGLKAGTIKPGQYGPYKGPDGRYYATGGPVTGPGTGTSDSIPAWLSNGEHVWTADEVAALGGQQAMLSLRAAVVSGKRVEVGDEAPGFARGGAVTWPYPTTVAKTRIPSREEVAAAVIPAGPSGHVSDWIERVARMLVPGIRTLSKDRTGATTLSGNVSYHARGRAVDFEPSEKLARRWNELYKSQTKELISPYQQHNIHNGQRHTYTGAIWNQHNFSGGNPHDHIAMSGGGVIAEPVVGVGASGRTYSFAEAGPERVLTAAQTAAGMGGGGVTNYITIAPQLTPTMHPREVGRQIAEHLAPYLEAGGSIVVRGQTVLSGAAS